MHRSLSLLITSLLLASPFATAAPDTTPVAHWDFSSAPPVAMGMKSHGAVKWNQPGPRSPEFPDFPKDNHAVSIGGKGSYLSFPDVDAAKPSPYQYRNGDEVTFETWIRVRRIQQGQTFFIIGKGRTGQPGLPQDNLNWALRVSGVNEEARLNFVFNTQSDAGKTRWHRWTSNLGFIPKSGWHHLTLRYRFGHPETIRGWIDGVPTDGAWDMDGPTKSPPPADSSDLWIGSSLRRNETVSFDGWIHSISLHRTSLTDAQVAARFNRVGGPNLAVPQPERMPQIDNIPPGVVLITVSESLASHRRWPYQGEPTPKEITRWTSDKFLLPRLPLRYDDWGIRSAWKAPLHLVMAADINFPPGKQTLLLRSRGLGRLWINGKLIARTKADTERQQSTGGRNPIFLHQPPLPGLRPVQDYMQEIVTETVIDDDASDDQPRTHRVVLELVVGGQGIRTQTGETLLASLTPDGQTYHLLQPSTQPHVPLTNEAIENTLVHIENHLTQFDTTQRRRIAAALDPFWKKRHAAARQWAAQNPSPRIPDTKTPTPHPVDAFLQAKIDQALAASSSDRGRQADHFHHQILPIMQEECFRCHGERDRGGLKLNSREAALLAGDSELPAIVPGKPEQSEFIARLLTDDESEKMPPTGDGLTPDQVRLLKDWIRDGAQWPDPPVNPALLASAPILDDASYLRRVHFDIIGLPPTDQEIEFFLADETPDKRERIIDHLLADPRMADHWISYWLDLLAENPSLLSPTMNSTGPFRWFLYDALHDHKPLDRFITELLVMRGGMDEGGSIGFSVAGENDAPFAEKGHIVAAAFLGVEMQCARCHDSPYHSTTQRDLFALAAMFDRKPVKVPATSSVPAAFFENNPRASLIKVTLKPGEQVTPHWPFAEVTGVTDTPALDRLMLDKSDSRERLAALITAPGNQRFAQVIVNRLWKQLMGAGIVEPVHDWEGRQSSHPELLSWLAHQFVSDGYNISGLIRLITTSQAYQRQGIGNNLTASASHRFFQAPDRRRLSAEQIVDALHVVTSTPMDVEELTFDPQGRWPAKSRITLGNPSRAWMLADLKNERDRPSLSLPKARVVMDVLEAFGWNGARQKPIVHRETDPNVLQPGTLANSVLTTTLTRASQHSYLAQIALEASTPDSLVHTLFLRILNRPPNPQEKKIFTQALALNFDKRLLAPDQITPPEPHERLPKITWLNHAIPEANTIVGKYETQVRQGPPPDPRLNPDWRTTYEDFIWSLINHREFVWLP